MGSNPSPEDAAELDMKKEKFQEIAGRALDDVNPDKNLDLHGDPKGDELRKFLNDQIKESEKVPPPMKKEEAPEEGKKLADQIAKTKDKLGEHGKGLDDQAKKAQEEAKKLKDDLPKALEFRFSSIPTPIPLPSSV